jgi:hypothetical protein
MAHFSLLDMGSISNAFDGDPDTIIRTEEANPLVIELDFLEDRDLQSVELKVGGGPARVSCWFYDRQGNELAANQVQLDQVPNPRFTTLDMQNRYATARVRLEIENTNEGEPAHVHLWEVTLK